MLQTMTLSDLVTQLIDSDNLIWVGALSLGFVAIVCRTARTIVSSLARERTRREIAAFIAEGAMTPEQGEKLMAAGESQRQSCC
jgi:hypothetical protein